MNRLTGLLLIVLSACADAQTVAIVSDSGESQVMYDCNAPDRTLLREESRQAVLDYVARMAGAGAVPVESLPRLMNAYEQREWEYLVPKVVEHACRDGVLPAREPQFPDPGTDAPAFQLTTLDGSRTVALGDHRGRHVILEFWATWCLPCIESLSEFNELVGQSPDQLVVLAINYGEDPDVARTWLERKGFDRVIGLADPDTAVAVAYLAKGRVGLNYLLDEQGCVVPGCDGCRMRAVGPEYGDLLAERLGW